MKNHKTSAGGQLSKMFGYIQMGQNSLRSNSMFISYDKFSLKTFFKYMLESINEISQKRTVTIVG